MKKLGIIGGLGPMATAYFMQLVIEMTDAAVDQDHIEMIVYSNPSTPDRTAYILGESKEDPSEEMIRAGKALTAAGMDILGIPCMTAHYFHQKLMEEIGAPIIHGIRETAIYLKERGIHCAGIMATDGTIQAKIFQSVLEEYGIEVVIPDEANQKKVMHVIYKNVKAGKPAEMGKFLSAAEYLKENGAEVIILGCTELSVIKRDEKVGPGFIDALDVLARKCVLECGNLKDEYQELITE